MSKKVTIAIMSAVGAVVAGALPLILSQVLGHNSTEPSGGPTTSSQVEQPQPTEQNPATTTPAPDEVQLAASKESAPVGATVQVSGKGFAGGESVEIRFGAELAG